MVKAKLDSKFVPARVIQKRYAIHERTLRNWADGGKLRHVRYHGDEGRRLYDYAHVRELLGDVEPTAAPEQCIVYARVSSAHQKEDLDRQCADLKQAFPTHELVCDIGSGLNFNRKGFKAILERSLSGMVKEVVVMHKDRLCRFGAELVEFILARSGTKLVVHGKEAGTNDTSELADDLLAVTTVFVARHNGLRSGANRRRRAESRQAEPRPAGEAAA